MKYDKDHWKNKYLQLLEKYTRLGEVILKALENIEPKKKVKPSKTPATNVIENILRLTDN